MFGLRSISGGACAALVGTLLGTGLAGVSAAQETKIALLSVQEAISRTGEGQKLIKELEDKYRPTQQRLESMQGDITRMRDQYQKGENTMSDEAKRTLARDIQRKEVELQRESEDARGEFNQEQGTLFNAVGSKMMAVIDKYSRDNGYQVVMDISSPQSPVLYAVNDVNITNAIIAAYDAAHPADGADAPK